MSLITISQDFASGGNAIARKVANDLQMDLDDDERLKAEAVKSGVKANELKGLEEKAPGFFDRLLGFKPDIYLDILQSVVYKIARQGSGVIIGHGSQILLKDFDCAFHIRVHAPKNDRVRKLMALENIDQNNADRIITSKDEEFRAFFQFAFKRSFNDVSQYDLILNTGKISVDTAANQIVSLAKSDEIIACSLNAMQAMDNLALEHLINAELLHKNISTQNVKIQVREKGVVEARGFVFSDDEKLTVESVLHNTPGVSKMESHVAVVHYNA